MMDQNFKNWIINLHDQIPPEEKPIFLRMLKFETEKLTGIIYDSLNDWAVTAMAETKESISIYDREQGSREIVAALREHFAPELAKI